MDRARKLQIVLPILIVVAILVWIPNVQTLFQQEDSAGLSRVLSDLDTTHNLLDKTIAMAQNVQRAKSTYQDWGRNPFITRDWVPPSMRETATAEKAPDAQLSARELLVLNGIFWNKIKPSALINDQVVGVGSQIDRFTVVDIKQDLVIIKDGAQNLPFSIKELTEKDQL